MIGMDRNTGLPLSGVEHIRQSIGDIISTVPGERRMLPEYGCWVRRYVDLPVNEGWKGAVAAEVVRAVGRWEPRVKLNQVSVIAITGGQITVRLQGDYESESFDFEVTA